MNIVVTGACGNIGTEIVRSLAQSPSNHIIALGRNKIALQELRDGVSGEATTQLTTIVFDLSEDEAAFAKLAQQLSSVVTSIDIVINNAGAFINKPFADTQQAEWDMLFATNIFGPAKLIRACLPLLLRAQRAHIVNIGSMGGVMGSVKFAGLAAYASSKAALANLTELLAAELPPTIHTNCLCFGSVATKMFMHAFPNGHAGITAPEAGTFIAHFAVHNQKLFNGKIIQIASTTP